MKKLFFVFLLIPFLANAQVANDFLDETNTADCCKFDFWYFKLAAGHDLIFSSYDIYVPSTDTSGAVALDFDLENYEYYIPSALLGLGYDFGEFRAEVDLGMSMFKMKNPNFERFNHYTQTELDEANASLEADGKTLQFKGMVNVLYDHFDEYTLFQPYAGLGGGAIYHQPNMDVLNGSDKLLGISGDVGFVPVGQLILGVNVNTNDYVFIDVSYKLLGSYGSTLTDVLQVDVADSVQGLNAEVNAGKKPYLNHVFELGARIPIRKN